MFLYAYNLNDMHKDIFPLNACILKGKNFYAFVLTEKHWELKINFHFESGIEIISIIKYFKNIHFLFLGFQV